MTSKYVDTSAIIQVIGNIFNDPSLLDLEDKYNFNEEDFPNEFHQIIFGSIYNLYKLGAKNITISTVEDYLENRPKKLAVYKVNNGSEYLQKVSNSVERAAFDYYYKRMKKMTLLRMYDSIGIDLTWLYDPDNIFDSKKKKLQEDWLDNSSIETIANEVDKKIEGIKLKYAEEANDDYVNAGAGIKDLIESLKKNPEVGYPLYGKFNNAIHRGARLKKFYLRSAPSGIGKALPNSTVIPTPNGDRKVGDVKVGDYLFDAFGKPTKVLGIYPQGEKEVWEVAFKDGRKAKCCEEHLWSYCTYGQKNKYKEQRKFYTSTTKELSTKELYKKKDGHKILVPMQKAVEYEKKEYYIKPYSFGLLLGDGSFRYLESQKAMSYSSEDGELPNYIAEEMNWNVRKNSEKNYSWTFSWKEEEKGHKNVWVEEALRHYPNLWNVKSEDKYIPTDYLEGDIQQRLDLLNGLLDSDGSVDKKGRVYFFTISKKLRDDVQKLARSLGFKTSAHEDCHKDTNVCYVIQIAGVPEDKVKLFKLKRKKALIEEWYNNGKRKEKNLFNPIIGINKLNYSEEMTCFYVDNEEHLFLMNDYIVTHNTRAMVADACTVACNKLYDKEKKKWVENGTKEPVIYISTEQELSEIQTMMLAFIADVEEEHILTGEYYDGEIERILKASDILSNSLLMVKEMPDFSLQDVENTIKYAIREFSCRYVFFDYIHTSMKILSEVSSKAGIKNLREDNVLFLMSVKLKDICNKYGVFIESSTQLNGSYQDAKIFDQNLLRGE